MPFAASALPALKPNQPNQSRPAPSSVNGTLCGSSAERRIVAPLADHERGDERRDAGVDVHDRAAREIERAHLREPAAAPDPVRDRRVDDDRPERDEDDVRREPHALDDGARDQRRRDDRERALVGHEQHVRDRALRLEADAAQEHARRVAEHRVAGGERQRVADRGPRRCRRSRAR